MAKAYVVTNETMNKALLGVYTSWGMAINSMLGYMTDARIGRIDDEAVGTRYHFLLDEKGESVEVSCYIEECEMNDLMYMEMNRMHSWN
jgi:hypothetical protein